MSADRLDPHVLLFGHPILLSDDPAAIIAHADVARGTGRVASYGLVCLAASLQEGADSEECRPDYRQMWMFWHMGIHMKWVADSTGTAQPSES